jgi:hypothetical protein
VVRPHHARRVLVLGVKEVKLSPEEVEALVDRMKSGVFSAADRQRVIEVLRAEQEILKLLEASMRPWLSETRRRAKRKRQMAKVSRRRNRCEECDGPP